VAAGLAGALAAGVLLPGPAPCADSRKLASRSLTSLMPMTRPTAIVMTRGTAMSMNRPFGAPGGDQCRLRIKSTSIDLRPIGKHFQPALYRRCGGPRSWGHRTCGLPDCRGGGYIPDGFIRRWP
jgi:hypothetical protein